MTITAAKHRELISIEEYLAGELVSETKHEYLGGYVHAMAGARNVHNEIATNWLIAVGKRLSGKPCRPFDSDTKVRVRHHRQTRFYYPDGMVVCEPNPPEESFQDRPVVIAEVLSESTWRVDVGEKLDSYLTIPSLETYLIIETNRARVVAHQRTDEGFIQNIYEGREAIVPLEAIAVELPLAELYERVEFP